MQEVEVAGKKYLSIKYKALEKLLKESDLSSTTVQLPSPAAISKPSFASPRPQIEAISHKRFTHQSVARTQRATHWIKNSRYGKRKETAAGSGTFDVCIRTGTSELQAHVHRGVEALSASH